MLLRINNALLYYNIFITKQYEVFFSIICSFNVFIMKLSTFFLTSGVYFITINASFMAFFKFYNNLLKYAFF